MKRFLTFAAALTCSIGLVAQPAAAAVSFPDVPKSSRFHDEVQYLVSKNIISGYLGGTFAPRNDVTRVEAAIFIGRMINLDGTKRTSDFSDVGKTYQRVVT